MGEFLNKISDELVQLVAASPGVVRVEARRRLPASGVVWSDDGVVVTANHILRWDERIRVGLPDGGLAEARLLGRDTSTDLAALQIPSGSATPARWSPTESLRVGSLVLALGRPGHSMQAALGILSAVGGDWQTPFGGTVERYLQTDAVMYPGFSGGPLVAAGGQTIGVMTSGLIRGVSLALPTETVRRVVEALIQDGRIRRGYLGVGTQAVRLPTAAAESTEQHAGLMVLSVEPESPADQAGILLGDILLSLDGARLDSLEALFGYLAGDRIGRPSKIRLLRGGAPLELDVTPAERP
jgi:S1-C subfamily serine protease